MRYIVLRNLLRIMDKVRKLGETNKGDTKS